MSYSLSECSEATQTCLPEEVSFQPGLGVNSKGIGINQFNSKSNSGIGAELELKYFERDDLELELKFFEQKELELNGKELSI